MNWWEWVVVIAAMAIIVFRICVLWKALSDDRATLSTGRAPSADDIRGDTKIERNGHLGWLVGTIRPKAKAGTLQEEAILVALEDRLIHGTPLLREASALCILLALALTFFRLHHDLPPMFSNGPLTTVALAPLLGLVGVNWSLIVAGLLFHVGSICERWIKVKHFELYRDWLERDIFPLLGVARTTGDRLAAAIVTFSKTVKEVNEALYPLSGLASAMGSFQEGLINELIPAMSRGLDGIKIGLSDTALKELGATTVESTRALREMKDHQAKMLTLITSGERRTADLANAVESIAKHTNTVATSLEAQSVILSSNNDSLTDLRVAIGKSTDSSWNLSLGIDRLNASTIEQTERVGEQASILTAIGVVLPTINSTLVDAQSSMSEVSLALADLVKSEGSLRTEMEQSRGAVTSVNENLLSSLKNAGLIKERWEEAMLQMASLADEISGRTRAFEQSTTNLSTAAESVVIRLQQVEGALNSVGTHIETLGRSTVEIESGNKSLVAAFGDLQAMGQKLKNLGHSITGHFTTWEQQTRNVYEKAQESTEHIGSTFDRMGTVVSGMESILRELSTAVARANHAAAVIPTVISSHPLANGGTIATPAVDGPVFSTPFETDGRFEEKE